MGNSQRRKVLKKNAKSIWRERTIGIITATLIFIALTFGTLQITAMILSLLIQAVGFSSFGQDILSIAALAVYIFAVTPIFFGYFKWIIETAFVPNFGNEAIQNVNSEIKDIFDVFSSAKKLSRTYVSLALNLTPIVIFALSALLTYFGITAVSSFFSGSVYYEFGNLLSSVSILLLITAEFSIAVYFSLRFCFAQYLYMKNDNLSMRTCLKISKSVSKGKKAEFLTLNLSFLPWYALSFFTAGILFVVFVFPYHILTAAEFLRYAETSETFNSESDIISQKI